MGFDFWKGVMFGMLVLSYDMHMLSQRLDEMSGSLHLIHIHELSHILSTTSSFNETVAINAKSCLKLLHSSKYVDRSIFNCTRTLRDMMVQHYDEEWLNNYLVYSLSVPWNLQDIFIAHIVAYNNGFRLELHKETINTIISMLESQHHIRTKN